MSRTRTSRVKVEVVGDARGGQQALRAISGEVDRTQKRMDAFTAGVTAGFTAHALPAVRNFVTGFTSEARKLQESAGAVRAVFGDQAGAIEQWASGSVESLGLARQEALSAVATFGNLFSAMQIAPNMTREMSTGLVELAKDMAAFNDTSVERVLEAMMSGVTGATRPLKDLGVNLDEVTLKQRAFDLGLIESTTGTLPAHVRAIASYHEILAQTANQQGTWTREAGNNAVAQLKFSATVKETQAAIGQGLMPALTALYNVGTPLVGVIGQNADAFVSLALAVGGLTAGRKLWDLADGFQAFRKQQIDTTMSIQAGQRAVEEGRLHWDMLRREVTATGREFYRVQGEIGGFSTGLQNLVASIGPQIAATLALTAVTYGVTKVWSDAKQRAADWKSDVDAVTNSLVSQGNVLDDVTEGWSRYIEQSSRFAERNQIDDLFEDLGLTASQLKADLLDGEEGLRRFITTMIEAGHVEEVTGQKRQNILDMHGQMVGQVIDIADAFIDSQGRVVQGNVDLIDSFQREQRVMEEGARILYQRALQSDDLTDAVRAEMQAFLDSTDASQPYIALLREFGPILEALGIDLGRYAGAVAAGGSAAEDAARQVQALVAANDALYQSLFGLDNVTLSVDKAFESFNNAMDGTTRSSGRAGRAVDVVAEKEKMLAAATRDVETAQRDLERANEGVTRSHEAYARAVEDAQDAERRHQEALERIVETQDAVREAEEAYQRALQGPSARDRDEAEMDLAAARRSQRDAARAVQEAESKLALERRRGANPDEIARLEDQLAAARDRQKQAAYRAQDAEKALDEIRNWSPQTDRKVQDAEDRLADARKRAEDAVRAADKAEQDKARKAQAIIDAEKGIERATRDAQAAWKALEDANAHANWVASQSPHALWAAAHGPSGLSSHAQSVYATRDAYAAFSQSIRQAVNDLIGLQVTNAKTTIELQRIGHMIDANPFLTAQQKADLRNFLSQAHLAKTGIPLFTPDFAGYGMAEGGAGTVTRPTWFLAGEAGEPEDFMFVPHSKGGIGGAAAGGGGQVVNLTVSLDGATIYGSSDFVREVERALAEMVRNGSPALRQIAKAGAR